MTEPQLLPPDVVDAGYREARRHLGRFNLGLFGPTGVGKSTLVNAVFGTELAETGIGDPVTQGSQLYRHHTSNLGVIDTKGLEIGDTSRETLASLRRFVTDNRQGSVADQIHVVWYCVRAGDRRIQPAEGEFIRQVALLQIPVLLVMTQTPLTAAGRPHPDAVVLADAIQRLRLPVRGDVHLVNALADAFGGTPAHGLDELLDATAAVAPDGVRSALAAAQRVSLRQKRLQAEAEIERSDRRVSSRVFLRGLGTEWASMFASIAAIYGMPEVSSRLVLDDARTLVRLRRMLRIGNSGLLVVLTAPVSAISLSRRLLRRFRSDDVAGVPVGWADQDDDQEVRAEKQRIGSGFAAGQVTRALGEAWTQTLEEFWARSFPAPPDYRDHEQLAAHFADELHSRLPRLMQRWEERARRREAR